eukprot:1513953-Alexandrium_andersonii.AAC.1
MGAGGGHHHRPPPPGPPGRPAVAPLAQEQPHGEGRLEEWQVAWAGVVAEALRPQPEVPAEAGHRRATEHCGAR